MEPQRIYVELLGEGVTVYGPVAAEAEHDGSFEFPTDRPEGERRAFDAGSRAICELRDIGGPVAVLVAVRLA